MYKFLKVFAYILVIVGALNWGLIGFFDYNLVERLFGEMSTLTRIIYSLVGIAAIISPITAYMCYEKHKNKYDEY